MSTAAQRHGYWKAKGRDYGYIDPLDANGMPTSCYNANRDEIAAWARTHGYPQWPAGHPVWAYLTDVDRNAMRAWFQFHHRMRQARQARLAGHGGEAAYHLRCAASARGTYAFNRRMSALGVTSIPIVYHDWEAS